MPVINIFKDIFEKRDVIYGLTKQDFKTRFAGSVLGLLWAFIQPLAMMLILWFVFSVGLKMGLTRNIPFPAWFFTAMILWNFVSDFILTATNVFGEYSFLVKKNLPLLWARAVPFWARSVHKGEGFPLPPKLCLRR